MASPSALCSRPIDVDALWPPNGTDEPVDAYGRLGPVAGGRPAVRLNMIASADGAAYVEGRSGALGGRADKALFATLRSLADVILVGAATMRTEGYGPARLDKVSRQGRTDRGLAPVPPIAVVTRKCQLDWRAPFFADAEERPLIITVSTADGADRRRAEEVADVIVAGEGKVELARAVAALGERGYENVLAEGGPGIAAQLAAESLLDEVCLTIAPMLVGGDARRIFDGPPLQPMNGLRLAHVFAADGYLFLHYRL
jgi:riboflavin biosynthesis pyrimidine reductase